jgi:hypothetical protein
LHDSGDARGGRSAPEGRHVLSAERVDRDKWSGLAASTLVRRRGHGTLPDCHDRENSRYSASWPLPPRSAEADTRGDQWARVTPETSGETDSQANVSFVAHPPESPSCSPGRDWSRNGCTVGTERGLRRRPASTPDQRARGGLALLRQVEVRRASARRGAWQAGQRGNQRAMARAIASRMVAKLSAK